MLWLHTLEVQSGTHLRDTLTTRVRRTQSGTHLRGTYQNGSQVTHFRGTLSACVRSAESSYTSQRYSDSTHQKDTVRYTSQNSCFRLIDFFDFFMGGGEGGRLHLFFFFWLKKQHVRNTLTGYTLSEVLWLNVSGGGGGLHLSKVLWLHMSEIHLQATHLRGTLTKRVRRTQSGYTSQGYSTRVRSTQATHLWVHWLHMSKGHSQATHLRGTVRRGRARARSVPFSDGFTRIDYRRVLWSNPPNLTLILLLRGALVKGQDQGRLADLLILEWDCLPLRRPKEPCFLLVCLFALWTHSGCIATHSAMYNCLSRFGLAVRR